jgi:putative membrane protein
MQHPSLNRTIIAAALLSLAAAAPLAVQAAGAPDTAPGKMTGAGVADAKSALSSADRKFIEKAAQGGVAEVQMGKLAAQKAQSAEVKQFGEHMAKDHTRPTTS